MDGQRARFCAAVDFHRIVFSPEHPRARAAARINLFRTRGKDRRSPVETHLYVYVYFPVAKNKEENRISSEETLQWGSERPAGLPAMINICIYISLQLHLAESERSFPRHARARWPDTDFTAPCGVQRARRHNKARTGELEIVASRSSEQIRPRCAGREATSTRARDRAFGAASLWCSYRSWPIWRSEIMKIG